MKQFPLDLTTFSRCLSSLSLSILLSPSLSYFSKKQAKCEDKVRASEKRNYILKFTLLIDQSVLVDSRA